jgi:hypothetical protein
MIQLVCGGALNQLEGCICDTSMRAPYEQQLFWARRRDLFTKLRKASKSRLSQLDVFNCADDHPSIKEVYG